MYLVYLEQEWHITLQRNNKNNDIATLTSVNESRNIVTKHLCSFRTILININLCIICYSILSSVYSTRFSEVKKRLIVLRYYR